MRILRMGAAGLAAALLLSACGGGEEPAGNAKNDGGNAGKHVRLWLVGTDTPKEVRDYATAEF